MSGGHLLSETHKIGGWIQLTIQWGNMLPPHRRATTKTASTARWHSACATLSVAGRRFAYEILVRERDGSCAVARDNAATAIYSDDVRSGVP